MKRLLAILVMVIGLAFQSEAMSYEQARQQALFLTDKMAYELNMTDDQYEAAYEINLDYLMSVNTYDDLYGSYWRYRNLDLSYVLLDWQYRAFCNAAYFYRPLYFDAGCWHFAIYSRYPHRDYFYFSRPRIYVSYRGGHSWGRNGGRSWYNGRQIAPRPGANHFGMRDAFKRGDYGKGNRQSFGSRPPQRIDSKPSFGNRGNGNSFGNRPNGTPGNNRPNNSSFGNRPSNNGGQFGNNRPNNGSFGNRGNMPSDSRGSSTRVTVNKPNSPQGNSQFGSRRGGDTGSKPRSTFMPSTSRQGNSGSPSFGTRSGNSGSPSFGGNRGGSVGAPSRGGGQPSGGGSSRGSFGSRR